MTLWVFDIAAAEPTGAVGGVSEGRVEAGGPASAGEFSRAAVAVEKLRSEAIMRGDCVIDIINLPPRNVIEILRLWEKSWLSHIYVSNNLQKLTLSMMKTDWSIIDARTLSIEDGKVVASAV